MFCDFGSNYKYRIRPHYRAVRLGFSTLPGKLVVKYKSAYYRYTLKTRSTKDFFNVVYAMNFFSIFYIKAYVVGTHLNCIDKSMQFKWVTTTYVFIKKVDQKYTCCNLATTELTVRL